MTVSELIDELRELKDEGYGDGRVVYYDDIGYCRDVCLTCTPRYDCRNEPFRRAYGEPLITTLEVFM